jgi:hypothetical protein
MRQIHLEPPQIEGQTATFRWRVEPESALYHRTHFTLRFPPAVDLARVPERLWWDVFLICLHPHWLLLRPCRIHLPLRLGAAERAFWLQHLENGMDTLAVYGPQQYRGQPLDIEIVDGDREIPRAPVAGNGCAAAFSGGKDSLLQAALLSELTEHPVLVATTAPMPGTADHETARRREVFAAIQARRPVRFVEAESDFRACWNQGFAGTLGYRAGLNELTDTFLYLASTLVAGAAMGAPRIFVASECEVQDNGVIGGKIVQHLHFMYSAATQRALSRLLEPYGMRYGSLTWPLYSSHVQHLLWSRYPDLSDLQYSCWLVAKDEAMCSRCRQCLRLAVVALAAGFDPRRMGLDLEKLLKFADEWKVTHVEPPAADALPSEIGSRRFQALTADAIRRTSLLHLAFLLADRRPLRVLAPATLRALAPFRRLKRRVRDVPPPPRIGVREGFCDWLDPELRERLVAIFRQHLPLEPRAEHSAIQERSAALTARAVAALH